MDAVIRSIVPPLTAPRARLAAWVATLAVLAIAVLIVGRRSAGAFSDRLALGPLIATLIAATTTLAAARLLWPPGDDAQAGRERVAVGWCGTIALWMLCLGCSPPSLGSFQWLVWLPLLAIDHVSRTRLLAPPTGVPPDDIPELRMVATCVAQGVDADQLEEHVLQELVRTRTPDGVESIRGTLTAEFAAGQRHATLHVGFCPPLERLPEVEVEVADGPDASVRVTQALAHGATLELRLAEPAEEACRVVVEFSATPSAPLPRRG